MNVQRPPPPFSSPTSDTQGPSMGLPHEGSVQSEPATWRKRQLTYLRSTENNTVFIECHLAYHSGYGSEVGSMAGARYERVRGKSQLVAKAGEDSDTSSQNIEFPVRERFGASEARKARRVILRGPEVKSAPRVDTITRPSRSNALSQPPCHHYSSPHFLRSPAYTSCTWARTAWRSTGDRTLVHHPPFAPRRSEPSVDRSYICAKPRGVRQGRERLLQEREKTANKGPKDAKVLEVSLVGRGRGRPRSDPSQRTRPGRQRLRRPLLPLS